jgi:hypothetical protein
MRILTPVLVAFAFLLPCCGDDAAKAAEKAGEAKGTVEAGKEMLAKQAPQFEKVKTSISSLTSTLSGITDGPTAEKAKATLDGLATTLMTQLGDLSNLGKLADSLAAEKATLLKAPVDKIKSLLANADVKAKIGGVLEQLQALLK